MPPIKTFNFGETQASQEIQRSQLMYPLDPESEGSLKLSLERNIRDIVVHHIRVTNTLPTGTTSFAVASNYMVMSATGAVTIARIVGGREGQNLVLEFTDANITITDDGSGNQDTVNLASSFTGSANMILVLQYNGISWREVSRAVSALPLSGGTMTGDIDMQGNNIHWNEYNNGNSGASITIDWNANGHKQVVTLNNNSVTVAFTNPPGASNLVLRVVQDTTGSRAVGSWDADILWPSNGTAPSLSTGASDADILSFYFSDANSKYYGAAIYDFA